jgi:hypothetical protein
MYVPLGQDVLMPITSPSEPLPSTIVGPFELRDETLSGALQLLLDAPIFRSLLSRGQTAVRPSP